MWLRIRCQETPSSCARGSVLHEQLPGSLVETRHVLFQQKFVRLPAPPASIGFGRQIVERKRKVGEFQESVVIDIHLFLDILARNGAVAEAGLAQETPARFVKARYHLL